MRGLRSSGTLGDVNADGIPDLVVGIQNGGLRWFSGTAVGIASPVQPMPRVIAPNPARSGGFIRLELQQPTRLEWLDLRGRQVFAMGIKQAGTASLPAPKTPGLYLLTTQPAAGGMIQTVRVVVQ